MLATALPLFLLTTMGALLFFPVLFTCCGCVRRKKTTTPAGESPTDGKLLKTKSPAAKKDVTQKAKQAKKTETRRTRLETAVMDKKRSRRSRTRSRRQQQKTQQLRTLDQRKAKERRRQSTAGDRKQHRDSKPCVAHTRRMMVTEHQPKLRLERSITELTRMDPDILSKGSQKTCATEEQTQLQQPEQAADTMMGTGATADNGTSGKTITGQDSKSLEMKVSPSTLHFDGEDPDLTVPMEVSNGTDDRMAVKIKSTDATIFKVEPVYFIMEPRTKQVVMVKRLECLPKPDIIEVVIAKVPEGADGSDVPAVFRLVDKAQLKSAQIAVEVYSTAS